MPNWEYNTVKTPKQVEKGRGGIKIRKKLKKNAF
jgi:hypothetical protein